MELEELFGLQGNKVPKSIAGKIWLKIFADVKFWAVVNCALSQSVIVLYQLIVLYHNHCATHNQC